MSITVSTAKSWNIRNRLARLKYGGVIGGLALSALLVWPAISAQTRNATVSIKLTVVAPPCIINGNRPIEVEFGDVITTRVDGINYLKKVDYTLSCEVGASNAMQLQVQGTGAAFDNTVLRTNRDGLGIKLLRVGANLPVNSWVPFTYPNAPELYAAPVKAPGVLLTAGEFSAAASMRVAYQ